MSGKNPLISLNFSFFPSVLGSLGVDSYLSLDDVEEEVGVAAAAEEVTQTERLVQAFHLLLDLRRRSTRRTPEHKRKTRVRLALRTLAEHFALGASPRFDLPVIFCIL